MAVASANFYDQDVEGDWDDGDGIGDVMELFGAVFGDEVRHVERLAFSADVKVPLLGEGPDPEAKPWNVNCWECVYDPDHDHIG